MQIKQPKGIKLKIEWYERKGVNLYEASEEKDSKQMGIKQGLSVVTNVLLSASTQNDLSEVMMQVVA
jgi:spore germination protein GerM